MRNFPFNINSAIDFARLITISKGSRVVRFSDKREEVTISGTTWKTAEGCVVGAMATRNDGGVSNCTVYVQASPNGPIKFGEAAAGLFDGANATLLAADPQHPELGSLTMLSGYIGQVTEDRNGWVSLEIRGQLTRARAIVTEKFGPMCRADLGDDRCKIPLLPGDVLRSTDYVLCVPKNYKKVNNAWVRVRTDTTGTPFDYANVVYGNTSPGTTDPGPVSYDPTIGAVTVDGGAEFTTFNSYTRAAIIDAVVNSQTILLSNLDEPRALVDGWFTLGTLIIRSGLNSGIGLPISNSAGSTGDQTLKFAFDITRWISGGEYAEVCKGCDKTEATCFGEFNNIDNRRAETFAGTRDLANTGG